jgi:hypothetical protein
MLYRPARDYLRRGDFFAALPGEQNFRLRCTTTRQVRRRYSTSHFAWLIGKKRLV